MRSDPVQNLKMSRLTANSPTISSDLAQDFCKHGIERRNDRRDRLKLFCIGQALLWRQGNGYPVRQYSRAAS